ncbi:hypothetical protein D9M70_375770 [compost metagenome]
MIGVGAAQADQPFGAELGRLAQVADQLEPLVTGNQRIDQVQTQHRSFDSGALEPGQRQRLERRAGRPVGENERQNVS